MRIKYVNPDGEGGKLVTESGEEIEGILSISQTEDRSNKISQLTIVIQNPMQAKA